MNERTERVEPTDKTPEERTAAAADYLGMLAEAYRWEVAVLESHQRALESQTRRDNHLPGSNTEIQDLLTGAVSAARVKANEYSAQVSVAARMAGVIGVSPPDGTNTWAEAAVFAMRPPSPEASEESPTGA